MASNDEPTPPSTGDIAGGEHDSAADEPQAADKPQESEESDEKAAPVTAVALASSTFTRARNEALHDNLQACMNAKFDMARELQRAHADAWQPVEVAQERFRQAASTAGRDPDAFREFLDARQELFEAQQAYFTGSDLQERRAEVCRAFEQRQNELAEEMAQRTQDAREAFMSEMKAVWADLDPSRIDVASLAWSQVATAFASCA